MNIEILNLPDNSPFAVIQDLYSPEEQESLLKELDYLQTRKGLWLDPEDSGTAKDRENTPLKSNKCIWMNTLYKTNEASAILTSNLKIYNDGVATHLAQEHPWFKYLLYNSEFTTLLSYYENEGHYKAHRDSSVLTTLTWFYKEPKLFEGGDLVLENETTIKCSSNTMVIIPSTTLHEVTPIILEGSNMGKGLGRYTVTTFVTNTKISESQLS